MNRLSKFLIMGLLTTLIPGVVMAEFAINGVSTAELVNDPMGKYKYTLEITWDTGTQYAMSHINLLIDTGANCTCGIIADGISFDAMNGSLYGNPNDCELDVYTELNCQGDPSLGLSGIMLKFEPDETEDCEPDVTGQMTIVFYSNYRPAHIGQPNLALSDKFGQLSGFGNISGVFPALPCDTIDNDDTTWGSIKTHYR
jgi:hypothetical protein